MIIEQSVEHQTPLWLLFVYFEKAFDSVSRENIWTKKIVNLMEEEHNSHKKRGSERCSEKNRESKKCIWENQQDMKTKKQRRYKEKNI